MLYYIRYAISVLYNIKLYSYSSGVNDVREILPASGYRGTQMVDER